MTIDKQALREEFRYMQVHYSDPADRARQVIYIAAEALLDENLQLQREKDATEAVALALRDDMRQAREQLAAAERRIAELEAKLEIADKLQDSAFRDGLKAGFSYGQTDDQSGFAQCMSAYSTRTDIGVKVE
ncbi:ead/Ea22-like family protein [Salmonella enterica]|nr:ead/Ea22-like family protein [Salmonella enterica]EKM3557158.1 ead/Ea22-like family protein [Salmonella enterica]